MGFDQVAEPAAGRIDEEQREFLISEREQNLRKQYKAWQPQMLKEVRTAAWGT